MKVLAHGCITCPSGNRDRRGRKGTGGKDSRVLIESVVVAKAFRGLVCVLRILFLFAGRSHAVGVGRDGVGL